MVCTYIFIGDVSLGLRIIVVGANHLSAEAMSTVGRSVPSASVNSPQLSAEMMSTVGLSVPSAGITGTATTRWCSSI